MKRLLSLLAGLALLTAGAAFAHGFKVGAIEIDHPWARATAPGAANGAVYFTLTGVGADGDRLVSAASPVADKVELHMHIHDNGVMKMRPVNAIEVTPGSPTTLQPGGLHVMLLGLKQPLAKGKSFPLTLTFEKAGPTVVQVDVQGPGDMDPSHNAGHGDKKK